MISEEEVLELFISKTKAEIDLLAAHTPALEITEVDLQWVQVLAEGWASPLKGFMREDQYLQVSLYKNSNSFYRSSFVFVDDTLGFTFQHVGW